MKQIVFEVPGKVTGKGRPRFTHSGQPYTPSRTRIYERAIREAFAKAGGERISGPVHVDFEAVYGVQKSATKAQKAMRLSGAELAIMKPDVDNVEKCVLDALNGKAFPDDVNVVSIRAIKGRYEDKPRLIVRVREISPEEIAEIHSWLWGDAN